MSRKILVFTWIGELLLFALSVGAVSYSSGKQEWGLFTIFVILCVALFALIKYLQSEPIMSRIKALQRKEYNLSHRFSDWGLKAVFNMQDNKELQERNVANLEMIEKGNMFSLLAESGTSYIDPSIRRHWDALKTKLEQGFPLKILLINPFCSSKKIRNERNSIQSLIDPKLKLDLIASLLNRYENVEIRFTDEPYCSLFFTDNEMLYDPYHLGKAGDRIENYFLAIKLKKVDENQRNFYNLLKNHFEFLWSYAIPVPDFIRTYSSEIGPDIVNLFNR